MEEFYNLAEAYKKETGIDVSFLTRYLFIEEAIEFIKNSNGRKIDIIPDENATDSAIPIYLED